MKQIIKTLSSFNGVAFDSTATLPIPIGPVYNELHIHTSLTAAQLKQVVIRLNGDPIVQASGVDLVMMEKYKGNAIGNNSFIIPFSNPNAKNQNGALFGSLVTLRGDTLTMEVEIGAGTGAITLEVVAFQSPSVSDRTWVPRIRTHIMQANAAGWNDYTNYSAGEKTNIRRAYFKKAGITRLKIEVDNLIYHDVKATAMTIQQTRLKRVPQTDVYAFDPTMSGFEMADMFNTAFRSEFVFRVEVGAAGPIPILVESIEYVGLMPT